MIMGLAAFPLFLLTGLSIDFGVSMSARSALQNALDAALLAAGRTVDQSQRQQVASEYAAHVFGDKFGAHSLSVTLTESEDEIAGEATVVVPYFFAGLFGKEDHQLSAEGAVRVDVPPVEVMLVLDKTGSMAGAKLTALKNAATSLAETIMDGEKVRVGIVPFSRYVNIGMSLRNEPGFSIPADYQSCQNENVTTAINQRNCRQVTSTCTNDNGPYSCTYTVCDYDYVTTVQYICRNYTWRGCVGSRAAPYNVEDSNTSVPIPGLLNINCGNNPITRLTKDKNTITTAINALATEGYTYIPSGLMMGWHALTERPILPDGVDRSTLGPAGINRAIILMTDGANTASKPNNSPNHQGNNVNHANTATRTLCTNIKNDNIEMYTVSFQITDTGIKNIMKECASSEANAYDAENSSELTAAFEAIAKSLARLRLSR